MAPQWLLQSLLTTTRSTRASWLTRTTPTRHSRHRSAKTDTIWHRMRKLRQSMRTMIASRSSMRPAERLSKSSTSTRLTFLVSRVCQLSEALTSLSKMVNSFQSSVPLVVVRPLCWTSLVRLTSLRRVMSTSAVSESSSPRLIPCWPRFVWTNLALCSRPSTWLAHWRLSRTLSFLCSSRVSSRVRRSDSAPVSSCRTWASRSVWTISRTSSQVVNSSV